MNPLKRPHSHISPFSKVVQNKRIGVERLKPTKLDFDALDEQKTLTDLYGVNLEKPPQEDTTHLFFQVREQIELIEGVVERMASTTVQGSIRGKVKELVQALGYSEGVLVELGALFFFLDRDGQMPKSELPLSDLRKREIEEELEVLTKEYKEDLLVLSVPSCRTAYLIRALVRVMLTPSGKYSPGGALLVQNLLETEFPHYVRPEHLHQILDTLAALIKNPQTKKVLERELKVAKEMEQLIRLDWKLPKDGEVTSTLAKQACVIALFSSLRQQDAEGNCYAISALSMLMQERPLDAVEAFGKLLEKGTFTFQGKEFPVFPLIGESFHWHGELEQNIIEEDFSKSTAIQTVHQGIGLPVNSFDKFEFQEMEDLFTTNGADKEQVKQAQALLHSFKENALHRALLGQLQFCFVNHTGRESFLKGVFATKKEGLKDVEKEIRAHLWIADWTDPHVKIEGSKVSWHSPSGETKTFDLGRNDTALLGKKLLKEGRLFLVVDGGMVTFLLSQKELETFLFKMVEKTRVLKKKHKEIVEVLLEAFRKQQKKANDPHVKLTDLRYKGLPPILYQDGGDASVSLKQGLSFETKRIRLEKKGKSAEEFVGAIWENAATLAPRPLVIIGTKDHEFTLSRRNGALFFKHPEKAKELSKQAEKVLSEEWKGEIMVDSLHYICPHLEKKACQELVETEKITTQRELWALASEQKGKEERFHFLLGSIAIRGLDLETVFERLDVYSDPENGREALLLKGESLPIPRIAYLLHKFAVKEENRSDLTEEAIEQVLCELYNRPFSVYLGDLNWTNKESENPVHLKLYATWNLATEKLEFVERTKGIDAPAKLQMNSIELTYF